MFHTLFSPAMSVCSSLRCLQQISLIGAVGLFGACAPSPARAAYTFSKIVDTATTAPGSGSLFTSFSRVGYDGQNIAFIGKSGAGNLPGIYQWNGSQLDKTAFVGDAVPSAGVTFSNFANLSLDNGFVAFQGAGGALEGVYTTLGGSLRRVADTTTVMPDSTAIFSALIGIGTPSFDVALDGSDVYFSGFGSNGGVFEEGVYRESGGALTAIANRSTIFPGEVSPFVFFRGELDADNGDVLLEPDGLFTTHGAPAGSFRKVFDRDSTLPGLTPPLSMVSPNTYSLDNGTTAFIAVDGNTFDDYLYIQQPNGVNRRVVDETEIDPVTNNQFGDFSNHYSLSNGRVLFSAWSSFNAESVHTIYLSNDVGFEPILSDLETLDAKNLTSLNVFKDSLVDSDFVFQAAFSDGSRGLYLATLEADPPTQSIDIAPTFDVQLRPGDEFPIGDGQQTLVIDGGAGASFPVLDVLVEFPLGSVPAGAEITAAELQLDTTSSSTITIDALGYAGDGLASLSDEFIATIMIGSETGSVTPASDVTIPLDIAFIESLLGVHTHLGVRLASATAGPFVNIAALESLTGVEPTLALTFALDQPGDFDFDGDVDGFDFLKWQRGESPNPLTAQDLADWEANYGTAGPLAASSAAVPEPSTCVVLLLGMAAMLFRRDVVVS